MIWLNGFNQDSLELYSQQQGEHTSGCGPYSMAMAINLLAHNLVWAGEAAEVALEKNWLKVPGLGIPPQFQKRAIKKLAPGLTIDLRRGVNQADLLQCLADGCPALVTISWESTWEIVKKLIGSVAGKPGPVVGHVMVFVGFDEQQRIYQFLDPGNKGVTGYREEDFFRFWQQQSNMFIPPGSMLRVSL
jgi:hypothetical protein